MQLVRMLSMVASVEGAHDGGRGSGSSEFAEEVETLCAFLASAAVLLVQERSSVMCTPRNLVLLTLSTVAPLMVRGACRELHSPEVNDNLLRLLHIQREIVVTAPPGQAAHLAPVVCLISVADETHHSRVIRKFNEEVGVV